MERMPIIDRTPTMLGTKPIPDRKDLVDYNYAVAGHAGTLCDPDGVLFIKPCTQKEIDFYDSANNEHEDFAELMPLWMGTLLLNDATDVNSINEQLPGVADAISQHLKEEVVELAHSLHPKPEPVAGGPASDISSPWAPGRNKKIATDTAIVLENTAYGYVKPNIMDCKLGIRLWADDAPDDKKKRFDRISRETTHKDFGFRVAGMRVFRGSDDPKDLDPEEYRKYDKDWGRLSVNKDNLVCSIRRFIFNSAAGVDEESAKIVCQAFYENLRHVQKVLEAEESRMYSASLLFVCEGDGEALRRAVRKARAAARKSTPTPESAEAAVVASSASSGRSNTRVDSGIDMGEDGELIVEKGDGTTTTTTTLAHQAPPPSVAAVVLGEDGDDDDDDESEEDELPKIYSLRLIDFAHADWVPGEGPDENVLLGVRSLVKIFEELSQ